MTALKAKPKYTFHLLPNAHLDPVWLWDWKEGFNEGLTTVRTVLDLMDKFPKLTFVRGESSIYQYIEKTDPQTFRRIRDRIEEGRWDVVGGMVVQADTNQPSTETLCREFEIGLRYFKKNLGVTPRAAWQPDPFGHSAGLPNVLSSFGMDSFGFTRPTRHVFPLESPSFWWEGDHGNQIICYRPYWSGYANERFDLKGVLDHTLQQAELAKHHHIGVYFGMGNHGGGPTKRHVMDADLWQADHPNVEIKFSTLHSFFDEVRKEAVAATQTVPVVRGEIGLCFRGCYSSMQKFKNLYRRGEAAIASAEFTRSIVGTSIGVETNDLDASWYALAFNAFHDILPGTSVEKVFDDQIMYLGGAIHEAEKGKFHALKQLANLVDTRVPEPTHFDLPTDVPFLIWNPLPRSYQGTVEIEAGLDYRPLFQFEKKEVPLVVFDHENRPLPFQVIQPNHNYLPQYPWRKRLVVPVNIPAWGWTTVRMGWRETAGQAEREADGILANNPQPLNSQWSVEAIDGRVHVLKNGVNIFPNGLALSFRLVEDRWGAWGGMMEEKEACRLENLLEEWQLHESKVLEAGSLYTKIWAHWKGERSWVQVTFHITEGTPFVRAEGRLLWNERSARLKLILPSSGQTMYEVPGTVLQREDVGQVPGGRWVTRISGDQIFGFASDVLGDFDTTVDELRVTIARASRYATDVPMSRFDEPWHPAADCGELKFQFALFDQDTQPSAVADAILFPPSIIIPQAGEGPLTRMGSFGAIANIDLRLLSIEQQGKNNLNLRCQNQGRVRLDAEIQLGCRRVELGPIEVGEIKTYKLCKNQAGRWEMAAA